ncbi:SOS response-associated peptidase family protein [Pseudoduganella sp. SL102]|uniref:SOS response-associated peptidase n=1 Tax=Pseudoduganella sp. SL102 TaxID=2995154 RepID=UPI00248B8ED8|nr:SOS response-associated peptidase family protein [Pseudoduganella sp. SL102]WBS05531.1 SOS response-associated peptidase family protein [Pseudoduganella sp. SL102]
MCVNYVTVKRDSLARFAALDEKNAQIVPFDPRGEWEHEVWQDYAAPIIVAAPEGRRCLVASYGMVPQHRLAPGSRAYSTMNARSETVAELASYRDAWARSRFCLVPMERWFEPNYESGRHQRWSIGRADGAPLAVAGLWRAWEEPDGRRVCSFTQLTVNADAHPLLSRFHRPGDEKRALVPLEPALWDTWLRCRDPEAARRMLVLPEDDLLAAGPEPAAGTTDPQPELF